MAFLPSDFSGLVAWLRADAGVYSDLAGGTPAADGDPVGRWKDQSGFVKDKTSDGVTPPTYLANVAAYNHRAAIGFPAPGGQELTEPAGTVHGVGGSPPLDDYTIFVAFRGTSALATGGHSVLAWDFAAMGVLDGNLAAYAGAGTPHTVSDSVPYVAGTLYRGAFTRASSGPTNAFHVNGVDATDDGSGDASAVLSSYAVGGFAEGPFDSAYEGDVLEVIIYDRVLSAGEITAVDNYLSIKWTINAPASLALTARAKAGAYAEARIVLRAFDYPPWPLIRFHAAARAAGRARAKLLFTATSSAVSTGIGSSHVHVTQVVAEVLRGRLTGQAGAVQVTQLVVEVLVPYVAAGTFVMGAGGGSVVFTATAARVNPTVAKAATAALVFAATSAGARVRIDSASASKSLVFTASAGAVGSGHRAAALLRLTSTSANHASGVAPALARLILRARVRAKLRPIDFGDDYVGRFQAGQDVPLFVVVKDVNGRPTDPTVATPTARIYDLDTGSFVEAVGLAKLRDSRLDQVYTLTVRLSILYAPGRYGILYQAPTGGFLGVFLGIFEVTPGGDPASPAVAAHCLAGDREAWVLAQLGSGALAAGGKPEVT